jgi:hypothetical protein
MKNSPSAIYVAQGIVYSFLKGLDRTPNGVYNLILEAKNVESELRECELAGYGPDERLQTTVQELVRSLYSAHKTLYRLEDLVQDIVDALGWEIKYIGQDGRDEFDVVGECQDD